MSDLLPLLNNTKTKGYDNNKVCLIKNIFAKFHFVVSMLAANLSYSPPTPHKRGGVNSSCSFDLPARALASSYTQQQSYSGAAARKKTGASCSKRANLPHVCAVTRVKSPRKNLSSLSEDHGRLRQTYRKGLTRTWRHPAPVLW